MHIIHGVAMRSRSKIKKISQRITVRHVRIVEDGETLFLFADADVGADYLHSIEKKKGEESRYELQRHPSERGFWILDYKEKRRIDAGGYI